MKKNSFSKQRLENDLKNKLSTLLRQDVSDPRVRFASVTHVELNKDNSVAHIYLDTFQSENKKDVEIALEAMNKRLRTLLGQSLNIRHTPVLKFFYNSQYDDEAHIVNILNKES